MNIQKVYQAPVTTDYGLDAIAHWIYGDSSEDNAFAYGLYRGCVVNTWEQQNRIMSQLNSDLYHLSDTIDGWLKDPTPDNMQDLQMECDRIDRMIEEVKKVKQL